MHTHDPYSLPSQLLLNAQYLRELAGPQEFDAAALAAHRDATQAVESAWLARELATVDTAALPRRAEDFEPWYRARFREQVAAAEPFFDHLAQHATLQELSVYVLYEEQVDGRFDDVIAMAQMGLKGAAKVALAANYWDEMGMGDETQMHTRLFCDSAAYFRDAIDGTRFGRFVQPTAEALANGNLLLLLSVRREHCVKLMGALTLLEHTAPRRFARAVQGMRRLGVPEDIIYYHEMHVKIDAKHGDDLLNQVVLPMLQARPELTAEVATGVQLRLQVANRYYAMLADVFESARETGRSAALEAAA
ncbi:MAG: iron-containing redox enzyme family protein [Pseudomonadota bacterium]